MMQFKFCALTFDDVDEDEERWSCSLCVCWQMLFSSFQRCFRFFEFGCLGWSASCLLFCFTPTTHVVFKNIHFIKKTRLKHGFKK